LPFVYDGRGIAAVTLHAAEAALAAWILREEGVVAVVVCPGQPSRGDTLTEPPSSRTSIFPCR
jgi:hypothetical protein